MGELATKVNSAGDVAPGSGPVADWPPVTVGIPNYNYSKYVLEAIRSVDEQTYPHIELVIVDDCSSDNSVELIQSWIQNYKGARRIQFIENRVNAGLTKVCNQLLAAARGKYIQFLDADDAIMPGKILSQLTLLENTTEAALVYSDAVLVDENGEEITAAGYLAGIGYKSDQMPSGHVHEQLFDFNFVPLPSVLARTSSIREAGGFDETLAVQDYYMWLKLSEKYSFLYQPEFTARYRVHSHSMSNSKHTSPRSLDSQLQICYRYYRHGSDRVKRKIANLLCYASPNLYKAGYPTAHYWLAETFRVRPTAKNFLLKMASKLGVPYRHLSKRKVLSPLSALPFKK